MAKIFIYSTLTADQIYTSWKASANGVPQATSKILVKGGANLMTKHMVTPRGVVTEVTPEELAELRQNEVFKLHQANGFIQVSEAKTDVEKAVSDMVGRDQSAPLVEQDEEVPVPASDAEDNDKPRRGRPRKG